jgi:tRNA-2-methylthio-N6-dimethylallyladenosine synthase
MLLGQNVNSYRADGLKPPYGFIKLLEEADKVGIERIRFMTSHPKDANEDLFKAMRDLRSVCEHLHLPLQAGSDRILRLMNRGYTLSHYMGLVEKLRKILPNCSLTTDIIVGFPTESEEDFDKTLYALREIQFDSAFIFKYSPRPLTQASKRLIDDVSKEEKERRNILALSLQKEISLRKKKDILGKEVEVLFEEQNEDGLYLGKSRQNFTVLVEGQDLIGKIKMVKVEEAKINILKGKLI